MATTNVRKGAGRAAHAERTTRAAQRPCYFKDQPTKRPDCTGIATVKVGRFLLCDECNARRSTVGKGEATKPVMRATKEATSAEPLTRAKADGAYRRARKDLAGQGPAEYRKAAAKALGVTDAVFLAAYRAKDAQ